VYDLLFRCGRWARARQIVLAMGNLPHRSSFRATSEVGRDESRAGFVQRIGALDLPAGNDRHVIVIGTGLTAIDAVMEAEHLGFTGVYTVVSRHGRWPLPHPDAPIAIGADAHAFAQELVQEAATSPHTARTLFRRFRAAIAAGISPFEAIDAFRPHLSTIWRGLEIVERRRFLRHLRPLWDVHRHRAPAESLSVVRALQQSERLRLVRGSARLVQAGPNGAEIAVSNHGNDAIVIRADVVIECAGLCNDVRRAESPLLQNLLRGGFLEADDLRLGIRATAEGEILGSGDQVRRGCFTLGSLRRGDLWESTAVGEIRAQATSIARKIGACVFGDGRTAPRCRIAPAGVLSTLLALAISFCASSANAGDEVRVQAGQDGFSLQSGDGAFLLKLRGGLQLDSRWFVNDEKKQNLDSFQGRRIQPTIEGTVHGKYDFRLTYDLADSRANLLDAYVNVRPSSAFQVRYGKFKAPISLERLQAALDTRFVELAYPTSVAPNRDYGVVVHGDVAQSRINYAVGLMDGAPDGGSLDADNNDGKDVVARIFVTPFAGVKTSPLRGLGLGIAGSRGAQAGSLPSYRSAGRATVLSFRPEVTADDERTRLQPQGYWFVGPLGLLGEYGSSEQTGKLAGEKTSFRTEAFLISATYLLTGEKASFKTIVPSRPFDFAGGPGAIELAARHHVLAVDPVIFEKGLSDPSRSVRHAASWAGGINWYWNKNTRFTADYELTDFRRGASESTNRRTERYAQTRVQVGF